MVSNSEYNLTELDSIRAKLSDARLIVNDRNRGYAGGVNRALIECRAPFIFILNPDCRLADKQTIELIKFMEQNQDIAVVGPKVVDERGVVQPSCRRFPRPWTFLMVRGYLRRFPFSGDERRRYLMEDFDHNTSRDTDWISGGAILVGKAPLMLSGAWTSVSFYTWKMWIGVAGFGRLASVSYTFHVVRLSIEDNMQVSVEE